ncbi:elongator complex protein 2 isoform X2 [Syngnathus acus]|uniref:elongator complex protein 2 isoform X2 n=1 Tax=Syngnathus acus TaxID=161584 RepID=UPI0018862A05|nr:elongator complex protein 2 isoform X2 [Syngnathus acus]
MATLRLETCHVACSANRTPNVVSWGRGGALAFGTCHSVALYDPQERRVLSMLNGHTARVNAVQWVYKEDGGAETHLVSGGSDSRILLWAAQNGEGNLCRQGAQFPSCVQFVQSVECKGHTGAVCAVDALYVGTSILVASAAADSSVRLWRCGDTKEAECLHSLTLGNGFVMDVSLALLPGTRVPVLACGGDDSRVHLYVQSREEKLQRVLTLQGHEDWVRGVAWTAIGSELLLASCSQDCLIRVWRLRAKPGSGARAEGDRDDAVIRMKEDVFGVEWQEEDRVFAVALETVLAGHENWVYGVHWQPHGGGEKQEPLSLLSASMDKTMIIWKPDQESGVWTEQVRVGEVGGNTLGFYGGQMSPDGCMILAHAFHGALHLWSKDADSGEWRPDVVLSGHFDAVQDLIWDPEGQFVLSVSSDQTARLFTPWSGRPRPSWHEIARPQIHGYDVQCLAVLGRFRFVSGADEKVLRVFQAPRNFMDNLANISGTSREELLASDDCARLPEGASTPALGLSNKAVFQDGEEKFSGASDRYQESNFHPINMSEPPPEDHLLQNTLWPEVQKLYGHGFEMFCLASDRGGTVVASACKASKAEHASVLLWSASTWRQLQALPCHALTVTQMAFSPDAAMLLLVSRDRTWSLWRRQQAHPEPQYELYARTTKDTSVHSRILWSCDWSPDGAYFVTSSRDKKVLVWGPCPKDRRDDSVAPAEVKPCSSILDVGDSATAVTFCPQLCSDNSYLLAVGLECGRIIVFGWRPDGDHAGGQDWIRYGETDPSQSHTLAVKRLRWSPRAGRAGVPEESTSAWLQLASASADHAVKIFDVNAEACSPIPCSQSTELKKSEAEFATLHIKNQGHSQR